MSRCPACHSEVPSENRFCGSCGSALPPSTATPTETRPQTDPGVTPQAATAGPAIADPQTRFLPGEMVAERYRIVELLGRGGMGEVYRVDDLKLGQPVALKFLPEALEHDDGRRQRFLNEVKVALRVTHPNVCRVYDLGEVEGRQFISMEYVDGEDLASLLRRIGRLPEDKAVEIARRSAPASPPPTARASCTAT